MFIPKGKIIHENLATSYVLLEALVADLCEGGFSGVLEIVLRRATGYVIFDGGKVAAVMEKRDGDAYGKSSIAEMAAQARAERGRLSVYAYAEPIARALASLLHAEPLYTRLSSEFADLQKMVVKFMREGDRHWFIEVQTEQSTSLVFIHNGSCVVVTPTLITSGGPPEKLETVNRLALEELIDRCQRSGAMFDVYFRNPAEIPTIEVIAVEAPEAPAVVETSEPPATAEATASASAPPPLAAATIAAGEAAAVLAEAATAAGDEQDEAVVPTSHDVPAEQAAQAGSAGDERVLKEAELSAPPSADVAPEMDFEIDMEAPDVAIPTPPFASESPNGLEPPDRALPTRELMAMAGAGGHAAEDLRIVEATRLLSDIARSIEEITRIVEQRDDFPMHLRAGQLKVADHYPFLDPFGSDFEYIEGEIVFVGKANLHEFIVGVSEALRFAVTNAVQVSINPPRLRSEIVRKLRFIYERNREEFAKHGLDVSIEQIAGVQITSSL